MEFKETKSLSDMENNPIHPPCGCCKRNNVSTIAIYRNTGDCFPTIILCKDCIAEKFNMVPMKYYHFHQNNPGGVFIKVQELYDVNILACCYQKANDIARDKLPGWSDHCSCCGRRWSEKYDEHYGELFPHIHGVKEDNITIFKE